MTIKGDVIELLKSDWRSNYQLIIECKSAAAERAARFVRENPPEGYEFVQRPREIDGYNRCLEFRLIKQGE